MPLLGLPHWHFTDVGLTTSSVGLPHWCWACYVVLGFAMLTLGSGIHLHVFSNLPTQFHPKQNSLAHNPQERGEVHTTKHQVRKYRDGGWKMNQPWLMLGSNSTESTPMWHINPQSWLRVRVSVWYLCSNIEANLTLLEITPGNDDVSPHQFGDRWSSLIWTNKQFRFFLM